METRGPDLGIHTPSPRQGQTRRPERLWRRRSPYPTLVGTGLRHPSPRHIPSLTATKKALT